jgi:hypothetical protein
MILSMRAAKRRTSDCVVILAHQVTDLLGEQWMRCKITAD